MSDARAYTCACTLRTYIHVHYIYVRAFRANRYACLRKEKRDVDARKPVRLLVFCFSFSDDLDVVAVVGFRFGKSSTFSRNAFDLEKEEGGGERKSKHMIYRDIGINGTHE